MMRNIDKDSLICIKCIFAIIVNVRWFCENSNLYFDPWPSGHILWQFCCTFCPDLRKIWACNLPKVLQQGDYTAVESTVWFWWKFGFLSIWEIIAKIRKISRPDRCKFGDFLFVTTQRMLALCFSKTKYVKCVKCVYFTFAVWLLTFYRWAGFRDHSSSTPSSSSWQRYQVCCFSWQFTQRIIIIVVIIIIKFYEVLLVWSTWTPATSSRVNSK